MVDIQAVSIAIASAGVFVAAIYYILQLRHQTKTRKTDALWRVYQSFNSKEFLEASLKVWNLEFEDYNDFVEKYGPLLAESPVAVAVFLVGNLFEGVGDLLHKGLADYRTVSNIPTSTMWEKMRPIVEGARKQYNFPSLYNRFEYLYNETKKTQQPASKKA